ncbi:MAG: hypothetical protein RLZZ262_1948 [Bacteroidota bacterium]|jgi:two-component system, OmpR family, alkaline phosphatase synthesis response regulator PhoP
MNLIADKMEKILIVEDDVYIVELVSIHLRDLGYEIESAPDAEQGLKLVKSNTYALIVLDVMLAGAMDGFQLCQRLRALDIITPILMLTARSEEFDKVMGLESGADDYLTKPFGVREFTARVKAIMRRVQRNDAEVNLSRSVWSYRDLQVDVVKRKVHLRGEKLTLAPKEFDLLALLMKNPGTPFSREQLLEQVWGYEFNGYEHTVSSHVNRLRAKIELEVSKPQYILTAWGVGYSFNDEMTNEK